MPFDYEKVKSLLVCPVTKADLVHDGDALVCVDPTERRSYPIVDEIPRLLAEESQQLDQETWAVIMQKHGRSRSTGQPV
ncbi:MAG: hypothetical protein R3C49_08810 [Planctomycetaceae bacterium]